MHKYTYPLSENAWSCERYNLFLSMLLNISSENNILIFLWRKPCFEDLFANDIIVFVVALRCEICNPLYTFEPNKRFFAPRRIYDSTAVFVLWLQIHI